MNQLMSNQENLVDVFYTNIYIMESSNTDLNYTWSNNRSMIMAKVWTLKSIISVRYGFILSFIDDNSDKKILQHLPKKA